MTAPGGERTYNLGPVLPHVRRAAQLAGNLFNIDNVRGWRASARDLTGHPAGRALDFMVSDRDRGDALAEFLLANAESFGVTYVIWRQRYREPGGEWDPMEDRGSPTQNHMDHVHANFNLTGGNGRMPSLGTLDPRSQAEKLWDDTVGGWADDAMGLGLKLVLTAAALGVLVLGATRSVSPGRTPS